MLLQIARDSLKVVLFLLLFCFVPVLVNQTSASDSINLDTFQTYIVEFNLVEISEQDFAQLPDDNKTALIDKLVQKIENDTQLRIDIRVRYEFVPAVVIYMDHEGLQILKKHSVVKSISENSRLKAI